MLDLRAVAIRHVHRGAVGAHTHLVNIRVAGIAGTDRQALGFVYDARASGRSRRDGHVLALGARRLDHARRPRGLPGLQVCLQLLEGRGLAAVRDRTQVARHLERIDERPGNVIETHLVVVIPNGDSIAGDEDIASVAGLLHSNAVTERRDRSRVHVDQLQGSPALHGGQDRRVVSGADDQAVAHIPDLVARVLQCRDRLPLLLPLGGLPRPPGAGLGTRARHEDVTDSRQGRVIDPGGFLNLARRLVHRVGADDELVTDGHHAQRQTRGIAPRLRVTRIPDDLRLRARNIDGSNVDPLVAARGTSHVQGRAVHQGHHVLVLSPDS